MLRIAVIIATLAACAALPAREAEKPSPGFVIKAEYRQDALDYDDVEKRFIRETARFSYGESSLSVTHINIGLGRKENRFTFNITLRGISPYFDCIMGHYYANFGAGLLVGRKMALSPDLFSRTLTVSRGRSFTPCSSGNPFFCFQGIAAGAIYTSERITLSLHGYYSFRNRFVRNDRYHPDITGTSLASILIRTKRDYRYSEPVQVHDCGYSFVMTIAGHFSLQSYFIHTSIKRSGGHDLLWNFDTTSVPSGEKRFYGYGFYAQYRDDYILIFFDLCFPNRVVSSSLGRTRTVRGYGMMCGISFRHQACSVSVAGKQTDKDFYTPYGSGAGYPSTAWTASLSVRPLRRLTLGCAFLAEKNRVPSGNERHLRFIRRERVYLRYSAPLKGSFHITCAHAEEAKKEGTGRYLQIKASARAYIMRSMLLTAGGTIQRKGSGRWSGSLSCGIRLCLFNCLNVTLRYSRFFIAGGNSLYSSAYRPADAVSPGMYVNSSSNIAAGGLLLRIAGCSFSVEYLHQFSGARTLRSRVEASAGCRF